MGCDKSTCKVNFCMTFKFAAFIKVAHFWWILFFIYICWSPTYSTVNFHPTALSISPVWCHLSLVSSIVTAFITLKFKSGVFCIFLVSIPDRYLEQNYRAFQSDVLGRKLSQNLMIHKIWWSTLWKHDHLNSHFMECGCMTEALEADKRFEKQLLIHYRERETIFPSHHS